MVFIMPAFAASKVRYGFLIFLLLVSGASYAIQFHIQQATISKIGNGYVLNANINYPLTPRVKEAIENGVPIVFIQEIQIVKAYPLLGSYWQWEDTLWSSEIRHQLRYHALTDQYVLKSLDTDSQRNFISLNAALSALGKVSSLTLPPEHMADTNFLHVYLKSRIDLLALPTPMRPGALISEKWQLASPWTEATW
jgi:hypothetical protein